MSREKKPKQKKRAEHAKLALYNEIINILVKYPTTTDQEIATQLGRSEHTIRAVKSSDAFKTELKRRRTEVYETFDAITAENKGRTLNLALNVLQDALQADAVSPRLALDVYKELSPPKEQQSASPMQQPQQTVVVVSGGVISEARERARGMLSSEAVEAEHSQPQQATHSVALENLSEKHDEPVNPRGSEVSDVGGGDAQEELPLHEGDANSAENN